jgi:hypothetical protein
MTKTICKNCGCVQEPCVSGFNKEVATGFVDEVHLCKSCHHTLAIQIYELKTTNYINGEKYE